MVPSRRRFPVALLLAGTLSATLGGCAAVPLVGMMASQPAGAAAMACPTPGQPNAPASCDGNPFTMMMRGLTQAQPPPQGAPPRTSEVTALR